MITITEKTPIKISGISSLFIEFPYNTDVIATLKTCDKYNYDGKTHA